MLITIKCNIDYSNPCSYINILLPNGPRFPPKSKMSQEFSTIKDSCWWLVLVMSYLKNVSSLVSTEII